MKIQKFKTKDFFKIIFKKFFFENGNWIYFKDKVISAPPKLRFIFQKWHFYWKFRILKVNSESNFWTPSFSNENVEFWTSNVTFSHLFYWIITSLRHPTVEFQIFFLHFKFFIWIFEFSFSLEKIPNFSTSLLKLT